MARERVAVAMSGGVDSSVAAALLVEQGWEVIGFTMRLLPEQEDAVETRACCDAAAMEDARRVSQALGIRHYVLDAREPFAQLVIEPFCDAYAEGRTPNPCVHCNRHLKFGLLLRRAREIGADKLATGHYARVAYEEARRRWVIRRGVDKAKDQSYALFALSQEQLARALLPLGEMTKAQVRARARELGLQVAEKAESQQVCFVSGQSYADFVRGLRPQAARPGAIVDTAGRQLGCHPGLLYYTVGQRHGLRLAARGPRYVVSLQAESNRLVVGGPADLLAAGLTMRAVNYVGLAELPASGLDLEVKIRATAPLAPGRAWAEGDEVHVHFARPQRAVAPGQAAVCYQGDVLVLGGTIARGWPVECPEAGQDDAPPPVAGG